MLLWTKSTRPREDAYTTCTNPQLPHIEDTTLYTVSNSYYKRRAYPKIVLSEIVTFTPPLMSKYAPVSRFCAVLLEVLNPISIDNVSKNDGKMCDTF